MFLSGLNYQEKLNFLELAYYVANYNDFYAEQQKAMIEQYRQELNLSEEAYVIANKDIGVILDMFSKSTQEIKNAVFIEVMAIIFSDGQYDNKENEIAFKMRENFDISQEKYETIVGWLKDMEALYARATNIIKS